MSVSIQQKKITPRIAEEWLKHNFCNRRIKRRVVDRYKREMESGLWRLTGETIIIYTDGPDRIRLLDGQHRLLACYETGISFPCYVHFTEDAEVFRVIDSGTPRRDRDRMTDKEKEDFHNIDLAIAMSNWLLRHEGPETSATGYSPEEKLAFFNQYRDGIKFTDSAVAGRGCRGIVVAGVMSAIVKAYYHERDKTRLRECVDVLITGESSGKEDTAIIRLRNKLLLSVSDPINFSGQREDMYARTLTAIRLFMQRQSMRSTPQKASKDPYPLPG